MSKIVSRSGYIDCAVDKRDYGICMAYDDSKGVDIPKKFTTSFQPPYIKQISGNCVAQTIANIMEVMYYNTCGNHDDFSVGFIYGNRDAHEYDGEGMTGYMACNHLCEDGNVKSDVFDNPGEAPSIINAVSRFKKEHPEWKKLAYVPIAYVRTRNAEEVKKFIMKYDIPVMAVVDTKHFWWSGGFHAMALYGWDGDTAIMQNSWGEKKKPTVKVDFKDCEDFWLIMPYRIPAFSDLKKSHWAYKNIMKCVDEGVMLGYPDGSIKPDENITRAEFCSMLYRARHRKDK